MFNPEEPLAAILKATGRDEETVAKLMREVVTDFRTPKLDVEPGRTKYFDYIQPLTDSRGDVQLQSKAIGHGLAPNGMSIDVYDGGGANLFPASASPWRDSFYPPAATRLSIFHGGPYQYRDLRSIPTAAIYDYSKPESVAGFPNVIRVAQGGIEFSRSRFVVEQLGANGTVNLLQFYGNDISRVTRGRTGIAFSELSTARSQYEKRLGISPFSDFNPASTEFKVSA